MLRNISTSYENLKGEYFTERLMYYIIEEIKKKMNLKILILIIKIELKL